MSGSVSAEAERRALAARKALDAMNEALAHRPKQTGHDFSAASRCLTALREQMVTELRERPTPELRQRLERLNSVISVVYGGQFPIGAVPWEHVEQARDAFVRLLGDMGVDVDRPAV